MHSETLPQPVMERMTMTNGQPFDRFMFESVIKRGFFYTEFFEIYRLSRWWNSARNNKDLYDHGPTGCALQADIMDTGRHLVFKVGSEHARA